MNNKQQTFITDSYEKIRLSTSCAEDMEQYWSQHAGTAPKSPHFTS